MKLYHSIFPTLDRAKGSCIAILGGGGKSSFVFQIGKELSDHFSKVLLTSITKAGPETSVPISFLNDIDPYTSFNQQNPLYILKNRIKANKYQGITPNELKKLISYTDVTIFEADGARNLPLKAHNDHDPTIPPFVTHVVILIGADAVNTKITDGKVHRPSLFCQKWKLNEDDLLTPEIIAQVVTHPKGYLSKIKSNAPIRYFINKAGVFPNEAKLLGKAIVKRVQYPVYYGSIKSQWWKKQ